MLEEVRFGEFDADKRNDQMFSMVLGFLAIIAFIMFGFYLGMMV